MHRFCSLLDAGGLSSSTLPAIPGWLRSCAASGEPPEDWREFFDQIVFNAVVGNDDDHPRNHAVIYAGEEGRWRLPPAFDVVPNPDEIPKRLVMQVCSGL